MSIFHFLSSMGVWIMIIAVVAVGVWGKTREHELKIHQELRIREMEHERHMKELDLEIEKTKAQQAGQKVA